MRVVIEALLFLKVRENTRISHGESKTCDGIFSVALISYQVR